MCVKESYLANVLIVRSCVFFQEKELIPHPAPFGTIKLLPVISRHFQDLFLYWEATSPFG